MWMWRKFSLMTAYVCWYQIKNLPVLWIVVYSYVSRVCFPTIAGPCNVPSGSISVEGFQWKCKSPDFVPPWRNGKINILSSLNLNSKRSEGCEKQSSCFPFSASNYYHHPKVNPWPLSHCKEVWLIILWFIDTGKWNKFAKSDHLLSSQLSVESFSSLVHLFIVNFSITATAPRSCKWNFKTWQENDTI